MRLCHQQTAVAWAGTLVCTELSPDEFGLWRQEYGSIDSPWEFMYSSSAMRSRKSQKNPGASDHTSVTIDEVSVLNPTLGRATETATQQHAKRGLKHFTILKQWQCSSVDLRQT